MITSPKNERIKDAVKLKRKRHRTKTQRILVEGVRLIQDAVRSGHLPELLFYAPSLIDGRESATQLVADLAVQGVELAPCMPAALEPMTDTVASQGVVGLFPQPAFRLAPEARLILALDQVREPGNLGTLLRTAEAAGVEQVLVAPNTVDPYNDKALRSGMGAHFRLPIQQCTSWEEIQIACLQLCPTGVALYLADASAAQAYDQVDWSKPAVIVVGGEADGASPDAVAHCQAIAIPMIGQTESLNAAVAGAVILFEVARQRRLS